MRSIGPLPASISAHRCNMTSEHAWQPFSALTGHFSNLCLLFWTDGFWKHYERYPRNPQVPDQQVRQLILVTCVIHFLHTSISQGLAATSCIYKDHMFVTHTLDIIDV